jgi:CMP-N-acetylneuraminic acid synthetase
MARIAIMPARGGSKRIRDKNIIDFSGAPLMTHALATARASALFETIHVSTDDPRIAGVAEAYGFAPEFPRDTALADDHTPLLPVLKWVLGQYQARGRSFDTVCLLMAAAPLIEARDLSGACALFDRHGGSRPVLAAASFPCPVEWAFRLTPDNGLIPLQPGMAQVRSQDLGKAYYDTGTFLFLPAAQVLSYPDDQRDYLAYLLPRHKAVDIDDPEDLELAIRLFRGRP